MKLKREINFFCRFRSKYMHRTCYTYTSSTNGFGAAPRTGKSSALFKLGATLGFLRAALALAEYASAS